MGYSCTLHNYWWGTCLWPLSWPFPPATHNGGPYPCNSPSNCVSNTCPQTVMFSSGEQAMGPATPTEEPTHWNEKEEKFFVGLKENCQEAFHWDTNLVQVTRQSYFETHHPPFSQDRSHNLSSLFWEMITSANLLESEIYEIQEVWTRWKDLRYAHHALRSSPKGLQFFCLVSPSESLKVMGLKGIHHPNALCCYIELSYCPWCGKVGQNEGTVVNHLWTTHYK